MKRHVIIHSDFRRKEYFFSTDHCQEIHAPETYPKGDGWVPVSYWLPMHVEPQKGLESGIIQTIQELVKIVHPEDREIPNPDSRFAV